MFEYVPTAPDGPGYAIVTDRFLGLIGSDTRVWVVSELSQLLEQPDTRIGDVLDIFHAPASASRFALVEVVDPVARVLQVAVRGDVLVDVQGATADSFSGPRTANWVTGEVRGITSLRLSLGSGHTDASRLPLRRGVVHASEVRVQLASEQTAPCVVRPTGWTLRLPDGTMLDAAEPIVVGRRPWRSASDETATYYVVARSPRREISSRHLELRLVEDGLEARDLDSANGTVVRSPVLPPRLLHGGRATQLRTGDTLDLGEGFLITVGVRG